jgi:hypothetical protein
MLKSMKTIKLIVLAMFSAAIFNSCTIENQEKWYTDILEVNSRHWVLVGNLNEIGSYYEYIFDGFPYSDGIVSVYIYENFGTTDELQIPLPYTYYGIDILDDGTEQHYSIQYSYDIAADGTIALKVHISDYMTELFRPGTEYFRVAIIY